jgi:hypothetical protein
MTDAVRLDAFAAPPTFAMVLALLLLAGGDGLGLRLCRAVFACTGPDDPLWHRARAHLDGAVALSLLLYALTLAGAAPRALLAAIAVTLCLAGAVHRWLGRQAVSAAGRRLHAAWAESRLAERAAFALAGFILAGSGLVALGPPTAADALDYHLGVALLLLRDGAMPVRPEWFHSWLAGSGETLNALGLAIGAESFASLLQFTGLSAAAIIIAATAWRVNGPSRASVLGLAAVAAPVIVLLASRSKPQMVLLPVTAWTAHHYNAPLFSAVVSPLSCTWPGRADFTQDPRDAPDTTTPFPLSLFVPLAFAGLISVPGLASAALFGLRPAHAGRLVLLLVVAAAAVAIGAALLGQLTTRFFVALPVAAPRVRRGGARRYRAGWTRWLLLPQGVVTAVICWFGAVTLFPCALTPGQRRAGMSRAADATRSCAGPTLRCRPMPSSYRLRGRWRSHPARRIPWTGTATCRRTARRGRPTWLASRTGA